MKTEKSTWRLIREKREGNRAKLIGYVIGERLWEEKREERQKHTVHNVNIYTMHDAVIQAGLKDGKLKKIDSKCMK